MELCPVCNALTELLANCANCQEPLEDYGKVSDFLDPYGHYNDLDTIKSADGYTDPSICPHLLYCNNCGHEQVLFVHEKSLEN